MAVVDERTGNDEMEKWLRLMDNSMRDFYEGAMPVSDWVPHPNSSFPNMESMTAKGEENDPYKTLNPDGLFETKYVKQYDRNYSVTWSPTTGVFFVYLHGRYVQCHPTRY